MPRKCISSKMDIAPIVIRLAAKVSGGKSTKAMRTTMNAPPQIKPMRMIRSQLINPGEDTTLFFQFRRNKEGTTK
jgi:hypothetical protein